MCSSDQTSTSRVDARDDVSDVLKILESFLLDIRSPFFILSLPLAPHGTPFYYFQSLQQLWRVRTRVRFSYRRIFVELEFSSHMDKKTTEFFYHSIFRLFRLILRYSASHQTNLNKILPRLPKFTL